MAVVTPSRAPGDRAATGLCCWVLCQVGEQGSRVFAGGGGEGSSRLQGGVSAGRCCWSWEAASAKGGRFCSGAGSQGECSSSDVRNGKPSSFNPACACAAEQAVEAEHGSLTLEAAGALG